MTIVDSSLAIIGLSLIVLSVAWRSIHRRLMLQRFTATINDGSVATRNEAICSLGPKPLRAYTRILTDRIERERDNQFRCCLAALELSGGWESPQSLTTVRRWAVGACSSPDGSIPCPTAAHPAPVCAALTTAVERPPGDLGSAPTLADAAAPGRTRFGADQAVDYRCRDVRREGGYRDAT
jgi:hypothetical protein